MVVDVLHPGKATVSKADVGEGEAGKDILLHCRPLLHIWLQDPVWRWQVYWLRPYPWTLPKKIEPKYRLLRQGVIEAKTRGSRKQRKEKKNRTKKVRGTAKAKV